jgi:hypothetical protein
MVVFFMLKNKNVFVEKNYEKERMSRRWSKINEKFANNNFFLLSVFPIHEKIVEYHRFLLSFFLRSIRFNSSILDLYLRFVSVDIDESVNKWRKKTAHHLVYIVDKC